MLEKTTLEELSWRSPDENQSCSEKKLHQRFECESAVAQTLRFREKMARDSVQMMDPSVRENAGTPHVNCQRTDRRVLALFLV